MTMREIALLVLALEFALFALGVLWWTRRSRFRAAAVAEADAGALREAVASEEPSRRESLSELFRNTYRMRGPALTAKVDEYLEREQAFYQAMLGIYLERDGKRLQDIPSELLKVLAPWIDLGSRVADVSVTKSAEAGKLSAENARLNSELERTQQTIAKLLSEYSATFERFQHGDASEAAAPQANAANGARLETADSPAAPGMMTAGDPDGTADALFDEDSLFDNPGVVPLASAEDEDSIEDEIADLFGKKPGT